jgi:hypothetical protein
VTLNRVVASSLHGKRQITKHAVAGAPVRIGRAARVPGHNAAASSPHIARDEYRRDAKKGTDTRRGWRAQKVSDTNPGQTEISFGAIRVGALLARVRLHLLTSRFLAERRQDVIWEAGCDYATLAIARLMSRLHPATLDRSLRHGTAAARQTCGLTAHAKPPVTHCGDAGAVSSRVICARISDCASNLSHKSKGAR